MVIQQDERSRPSEVNGCLWSKEDCDVCKGVIREGE